MHNFYQCGILQINHGTSTYHLNQRFITKYLFHHPTNPLIIALQRQFGPFQEHDHQTMSKTMSTASISTQGSRTTVSSETHSIHSTQLMETENQRMMRYIDVLKSIIYEYQVK